MIVRGIDPGPEEVLWCDVDAHDGGPVNFVAMGSVAAADARELANVDPSMYALAIEIAYGLDLSPLASVAQAKARGGQTLATNRVADRIVEACRYRGVRVFELDDAAARRGIGVQFHKGGKGDGRMKVDKQIAVIVPELIRGFPRGRRESNPGKRDAGVYALHGAHLLSVEAGQRHDEQARREAEQRAHGRSFGAAPPGTFGPGDYGPDSFGGSDF
jgi:hypothetical protein